MSLLCFAGRHAAFPSSLRNQGLYFSSCRRCRRDMIRSDSQWKPVPRGFRVNWRTARTDRSAPAGAFVANLPVVVSIDAKTMMPLEEECRIRRESSFGALFGIGLRLLVWYGTDKLRQWRRDHRARRFEQSMLRLTAR